MKMRDLKNALDTLAFVSGELEEARKAVLRRGRKKVMAHRYEQLAEAEKRLEWLLEQEI